MNGYIYNPGSQRTPPPLTPLKDIIQRYNLVANSVNQREFARLIAFIRERWDPLPPAAEEWEEDENHTYRYEGWTEEGAFAMCVYKHAFWPCDHETIDRQGLICEAEVKGQVYFRPVESLIEDFPKPIREPQSASLISQKLSELRDSLQKQLEEVAPALRSCQVELPSDFAELMHLTDGVEGAGIPSQINDMTLVYPLRYHVVESYTSGKGDEGWRRWWIRRLSPLAAWKIGANGGQEWRVVHYVLCREGAGKANDDDDDDDAAAPPPLLTWKVIDHQGPGETDVYDNLSQYLLHETDHIEAVPGVLSLGGLLGGDNRFPDRCSVP